MAPLIIFCVAILGPLFVIILMMSVQRAEEFNERFEPISDAEFLARCPAGTDPDVALKVRRIVSKHLGVEYERVHPSARFVEDLEMG